MTKSTAKPQLDAEAIKAFLEANPQFNPYTKPGRKTGSKNKPIEVKPEMEIPVNVLEEKGITLTAKQAQALLKKPRKKLELSEAEKERRREVLAKGREVLAQKKAQKKLEEEALLASLKPKTVPVKVKPPRAQRVVKKKEVPIVSTSDEEEDTFDDDTTTDEETVRVKKKLEKRKKIIEEIDQKLASPPPQKAYTKYQLALASRGWNI